METYAVRVSNEDRAHKGPWLIRQASSALISGALQQGLQVRCEGLTALMEWCGDYWRGTGGPVRPWRAGPPRAAAAPTAAPYGTQRAAWQPGVPVCVTIAKQDFQEGDRTATCMRVETLRERGRHSSSFLWPPLSAPCRPTAALPRRLGRCGLPPNWDVLQILRVRALRHHSVLQENSKGS